MNCHKIQKLFIEAYYDELEDTVKSEFQFHLNQCSDCHSKYRQFENQLSSLNSYSRPEPTKQYWRSYWDKLSERIQRGTSPNIQTLKRKERTFSWNLLAHYRLAAIAISCLLVGVIIGRIVLREPVHEVAQTKSEIFPATQTVDYRAERYVERSKLLLLGLVNYDTDNDDDINLDLSHPKKISNELVAEAAVLKQDLAAHKNQHLKSLISDLEMILIQIANLEEEYDPEAIEVIRSSVEHNGILFKINLEEIMSAETQNKQKSRNLNKS